MVQYLCPEHGNLCGRELCCCADKHVSTPALNDRVRVLRDHVVDVVDELDRILWELDNGYSGREDS